MMIVGSPPRILLLIVASKLEVSFVPIPNSAPLYFIKVIVDSDLSPTDNLYFVCRRIDSQYLPRYWTESCEM